MSIYQCLFFNKGVVVHWENIEAESDSEIRAMLAKTIHDERWEAAEAWLDEAMVCRIAR